MNREKIELINEWKVGILTCPKCGRKMKIIHIDTPNWRPRKNFKRHKLEEMPQLDKENVRNK